MVAGLERLTQQTDPVVAISMAFPNNRVAADRLIDLDTINIKRSLAETIKNIDGLSWLVGGVDLSLNDDLQKGHDVAWQPQFFMALPWCPNCGSILCTPRQLPSDNGSASPSPFESVGPLRASLLVFVEERFRQAYRLPTGSRPTRQPRNCWHTRKVSLRPVEHVRAMLWMHRIGLAGRLFLRGVRMTRTGDSVGLVKIESEE